MNCGRTTHTSRSNDSIIVHALREASALSEIVRQPFGRLKVSAARRIPEECPSGPHHLSAWSAEL